jgi:hypothetical protein
MLRILILFGWARLVLRSEYHGIRLNILDKVMILWTVAGIISYTFLWETWQAFINRLGVSFDTLGSYFLIRCLVRDFHDIIYTIKALAVICVPLAIAMLIERATGRNAFAVFGGVPEFTLIRDGRLRCQGAFAHPILAGTFGASLLPLFLSLWWQGKGSKMFAIIGGIAVSTITFTSSSSGPIMTYAAGLAGLSLWPLRHHMRLMRWGMAYFVIALHLLMQAPVWALLARVTVVGGSTGYHRYYLFDEFIKHFNEWWLWGLKSTAHWGNHLFDVTNQFVRIGVDGGLVTLSLFIILIVLCYKSLGQTLWFSGIERRERLLIWTLGASLFAHVASFWGVSYFDQIIIALYILLAMISTVDSWRIQVLRDIRVRSEESHGDVRRRPQSVPYTLGRHRQSLAKRLSLL